ncbi:MAG: DNA primase [Alphaproteobacteria bacterium]|nr:DNA primase [Alphaproteobacteria bacterium]
MLPPDFLEEIRSRLTLSEVIGRRVKLIRAGREFKGLCPFHSEKSPSFTVNDDKGFFHCFGCGAHGSIFDFITKTENVSFIEAVESLANQAGLKMPARSSSDAERTQRAEGLYGVLELASKWFEAQLAGNAGRAARDYLKGRGVPDSAVTRFRIGLSPDHRTALQEALLARKVTEAQLLAAGLVVKPEDGGETFDRFRHRLMFPITDRRGRVVAFGGRTLGDHKAKYINSPETTLFHKGRLLYGLALAREAAREAGTIIVVEGYMDVIASAVAGVAHVVAPLGTALTEDQMRELWRLAPEPIVCLDGDAAGQRAAYAAAERALPLLQPGHSLRFAFLPEGDDPDTYVRKAGAGGFRTVLEAARPLSEVLWETRVKARRLDTPETRAALDRDLEEMVARIVDPTVRTYYQTAMRERLRQAFGSQAAVRPGFRGSRRAATPERPPRYEHRGAPPPTPQPPISPTYRRERLLVLTIVNHPGLVERLAEEMADLPFADNELDGLCKAILEVAGGESGLSGLDSAGLRQHLRERGLERALDRLKEGQGAQLNRFARPVAALDEAEHGWRHTYNLHRRAVTLPAEIKAAAESYAANPNVETKARLDALKEEKRAAGDEGSSGDFATASGHDAF